MSKAVPIWAPLKRNYETERSQLAASRAEATTHPLLSRIPGKVDATKTQSVEAIKDPLSSKAGKAPIQDPLMDPLSGALSKTSVDDDPLLSRGKETREIESRPAPTVTDNSSSTPTATATAADPMSWSVKKLQVLQDYAFSGSISLSSNAISDFAGSGVEDGSGTRKVDVYTKRLSNLERKINDDKVTMSQEEYANHINNLHEDLNAAWANDERVASLKIAIQLAKLLSDASYPQYYPYMFVMVSDVLDKFGEMVYVRLKNKAESCLSDGLAGGKRAVLKENFTSTDIPQTAKEICRNWFFKSACIRELIPRIYIEISLLRCYRFLTDNEFPQILSRLASIIRGIGDPLVATYARTYLINQGHYVVPNLSSHAIGMAQDTLFVMKQLQSKHHTETLERIKISHKEYTRFLAPGIEWIMKHAGRNASKETFQTILYQYREHCNDALALKYIIESFDASHYSHACLGMSTLIKAAQPSCFGVVDVFASMGRQLLTNPPPEDHRLPLLNDVWKLVTKTEDIVSHINCSYSWLDTLHKHYSEKEVLILLADVSTRIQAFNNSNSGATIPDVVVRQIESMVNSFLVASGANATILTSDHFNKLLDIFRGAKKVAICKDIMESFKSHGSTNDAILINALFEIGRVLHDSVDSLSPEGEKKHISSLIGSFIQKVDFGKELEQQLNVYVECRAIFCNLDQIKDTLVMCVSGLAMKAFKYVKGRHSKKTAAFVKACLAYCHITIPSIADGFRKLQLMTHCANIALINQCLPQTDTLLKAAISLIPDLPANEEIDGKRYVTEEKLATCIRSILSTLVVTPGHPEHGPFYIVSGLLNALPKYPWQTNTVVRSRLYAEMIALLCTFAQRKFPYRIAQVESNDELYGGAPGYLRELNETLNLTIEEILKQMTELNNQKDMKIQQSKVILDLVNQIAARMELNQDVGDFICNLFDLSAPHRGQFSRQEKRYWINTVEFVKSKASTAPCAGTVVPAMRGLL